jgi:polyisoprenoid-binding protein YceI
VNKWLKRALISVPVAIIVVYAAIFVYTEWINDPADPLTVADARELANAPDATASTITTVASATTADVTDRTGAETDGVWTISAGSEFGYRVKEVLGGVGTEAVGRGEGIAGSITIAGTQVTEGSFTAEVATIASDNSMRDGQFRGRVMETEQFPDASFELTSPIDLSTLPPVDGEVTALATGDLTLHGVTRPVTFEVTAVRGSQRIAVVGSIPVAFGDYDIDNPSNGAVTTEDDGMLEFNLGFEQG